MSQVYIKKPAYKSDIDNLQAQIDDIVGGGGGGSGGLIERVDDLEATVTFNTPYTVLGSDAASNSIKTKIFDPYINDGAISQPKISGLTTAIQDLHAKDTNLQEQIDAFESGVGGIDFTQPYVFVGSDASLATVVTKVTNDYVVDNTIAQNKIVGLPQVTSAFTNGNLNLANLGIVSATNETTTANQLLSYTGTRWKPGLIHTENIDDGQINTRTLFNGSVTSDKISDNAVLSNHLLNGSVTNPKLATNAVGDTKVGINEISLSKVKATTGSTFGVCTSNNSNATDGTATGWRLLDSNYITSLNTSKLNVNSGLALGTNKITTTATSFNNGELVTKDYVDAAAASAGVQDNSITNQKLADVNAFTLKGNNTSSAGDPLDLTISDVRTMLNINNTTNTDTSNASNISSGTLPADRIADNSVTNNKIISLAASKLTGQVADSQIAAVATTKLTGLVTNAQIENLAASKITGTISDSQIGGLSYSKLSSVPTSFPSRTSTLTVDANVNCAEFKITNSRVPDDSSELVAKGYVDTQIAAIPSTITPATKTSVTTTNAALAPGGVNGTYASFKNAITTSQAVYGVLSQSGGTSTFDSELVNVKYADQIYDEVLDTCQNDILSSPYVRANLYGGQPINKKEPPFYTYVYGWFNAFGTYDVAMPSVLNKKVQAWYDRTGKSGAFYQATTANQPTQQPVSGGAAYYVMSFTGGQLMFNSSLIFTRMGNYKNSLSNCTIFCAVKLNNITSVQTIYSADAGSFSYPRLAVDNRDGSNVAGGTYSLGVTTGTANGYSKLARTNGTGNIMAIQVNRWYLTCVQISAFSNPGNTYPSNGGAEITFPTQTSMWVDNQIVIDAFRTDNLEANATGFWIGQNNNIEPFNGYIAEMVVYNRALNSVERTRVYNYFREKAYADFNWTGI